MSDEATGRNNEDRQGMPEDLCQLYRGLAYKLGTLLNPKAMIQCCELEQSESRLNPSDVQWALNYAN